MYPKELIDQVASVLLPMVISISDLAAIQGANGLDDEAFTEVQQLALEQIARQNPQLVETVSEIIDAHDSYDNDPEVLLDGENIQFSPILDAIPPSDLT